MPHPIVKKGDVLYSGTTYFDGTEYVFHLVYRGWNDGRSIAPKEALPHLKMLGIEVSPHWNPTPSALGHMAAEESAFVEGFAEVSPHIKQFLSGDLKNGEVKFMLEEEY